MIVDMRTVSMGGDDKGVFSFQKSLGKFIANLVSFFGCHFSRPERLPYLIGNHIAFLPAPGGLFIKSLCQHKFFVYCQGTALIAADKFTLLGFVWVLDIAGMVIQTGGNGLPLIFAHGNQPCCSQFHHLLQKNAAQRRHSYLKSFS